MPTGALPARRIFMKKKLLLIVAMMAVLCCLLIVGASAAEVVFDNVYYSTSDNASAYEGYDGTATVNTKNQSNTATIISIPDTITVGEKTYVVDKIQSSAFNGNKTVQEIRILSKYITVIPNSMILNTNGGALSKIFIDFSIITTVEGAGLNPSTQSNGNSPVVNSFYYYDAKAFIADGSEVKITSPNFASLTSVGQAAFQGAQFEKLIVPASASLSIQCFRKVQANEIVIKGDRTSIPNYSFCECPNVSKIVVESRNLQTIGTSAFITNLSALTDTTCEIHIDMSKVTRIEGNAFVFGSKYDSGCTNVQWYNLEGEKIVDLSSVEYLYSACFASSNLGSAYIIWPKALAVFENQVFRRCNINQVVVINGKAGAKISIGDYALSSDYNTFAGVVCNENVVEINGTFPSATFAVLLGDSVKLNASKFVSSSTPLYCKGITVNTSFNKQEIATGAPLCYGLCGYGAEVKFADTTSLVLGTFNHTEGEGVPTTPSCLVPEGVEYHCARCDAFIRYEETAPAPGHTYDENVPDSVDPLTCTTNELKHYTCSTCSEKVTIITAYASGHEYTTLSYPVVSTVGVEGTKRFTCSKFGGTCGDYYEYAYRILPDEQDIRIEMIDGTKLVIKAKDILKYEVTEIDNIYKCKISNGSIKSSFVVGDVTYSTYDVKSMSFPYGITQIAQNFTSGYTNMTIIDLTDARDVSLPSTFRDNGNIVEVILGDGVKLQADSFRYINSLSIVRIADGATVVFPSSVNAFSDFRGLDKIIIGDGANVRFERNTTFNWNSATARRISAIEIGDGATVYFGYRTFNGEKSLATITFGENGNYTFAAECFQGTPLTALNIPASSTVTFDGNSAFKNCTALESVWLPANVTEIKKETFYGCTALSKVALLGATTLGESAFNATSDVPLTIYAHATGDLTLGSNALANRANVTLYTNSKNIISLSNATYTIYVGLVHAVTPHTEAETCFENGYIGYATDCPCGEIAYGATYMVYTSESTEGTENKLDEIIIIDEFDGHDLVITVTYANGYDKDGVKCTSCSRACGAEFDDVTLKPIITHKGYSYKLNGDGETGLQSGFHLDVEALNEYNLYNDDLVIGLAILNPKYLGDAFFNGNDVNATKGFLQVDIDVFTYSEISCMINFPENTNLAGLELSIFAYVFDGSDGVQLIQKQYTVGESAPVVSTVTKTDGKLHTVNLANVMTPVALPENLKEYEIPTT